MAGLERVTCQYCGIRFQRDAMGRPPKYCSDRCRVAGHREKHGRGMKVEDEVTIHGVRYIVLSAPSENIYVLSRWWPN